MCRGVVFPDRARFMGYASRAMRGLIIDYARRRYAQKRGSMFELTSLQTTIADRLTDANELQGISDALDELATVEPALAEIVDLKFFCGFSFSEIGAMRGVSERTVQRSWERRACICIARWAPLVQRRPSGLPRCVVQAFRPAIWQT
jgi:RNA polymerase sigma factor (sigma-70 family)